RWPCSWRSPRRGCRIWHAACSAWSRPLSPWSPWPPPSEATGCRSTCWGAWLSAGERRRWSGSYSAHRWACPRPMTSGCCSRGSAGPCRDALLVCRMPPGRALSDIDAAEISDAMLDDLYRQLLTLRRARIAHGAISGDAVLVDPVTGTVVLADFRNASERASPDQLDRDLAGAIAATAVVIGAERAADAAARCLEPQMMEGALR